MFILSRAWDKEKLLSPRRESNLWPPRYRLGALTTELRETRGELGHFSRFKYSYFEKGCRKKATKCTRQDRKVVWVFTGILHIGLEEMYKFVFLHVENLFSFSLRRP